MCADINYFGFLSPRMLAFSKFLPQFNCGSMHCGDAEAVLNSFVQTDSEPCLLKSTVTMSLLCLLLFSGSLKFASVAKLCVCHCADLVEILEAGEQPRLAVESSPEKSSVMGNREKTGFKNEAVCRDRGKQRVPRLSWCLSGGS